MGMRDKLRRLEKAVRGDNDWIDLRDGTRFYFKPMDAQTALYLRVMDALRGIHAPDLSEGAVGTETQSSAETRSPAETYARELFEALAKATPESLRRFERRYGSAERSGAVIHDDGTITIRSIAVDGSATMQVLEGEEAREYRAKTWGHPGRF